MQIFHVTHVSYLESILARGLAPGMARASKRVWAVTSARALAWAMEHVREDHDWWPDALVILGYKTPRGMWCRSSRPGVIWTPFPIVQRLNFVRRLDNTGISGRTSRWAPLPS